LKKPLLELPRYGCVNIHASLLPRYRGASPITQAIANGDAATGVCFMDMEVGLDSGKVYYTIERKLIGNEYADALEIELGEMAAEKTLEVLENIANGTFAGTVQDPALVTMTTKLKKSDGFIDWQKSASEIEAMVRAYTPWPGASFDLEINGESKTLIITKAQVLENSLNAPAGTIIRADKKKFVIACGCSALEIIELIPPGKKAMTGANYLNGCREPLTGKNLLKV
jgi:methionyl-tRNA formyltransferase